MERAETFLARSTVQSQWRAMFPFENDLTSTRLNDSGDFGSISTELGVKNRLQYIDVPEARPLALGAHGTFT